MLFPPEITGQHLIICIRHHSDQQINYTFIEQKHCRGENYQILYFHIKNSGLHPLLFNKIDIFGNA